MAVSETRQIVNLDGIILDARFSVEVNRGQTSIIVESRGGTIGAGNARNLEYASGLRTLLERLAQLDASIVDAFVDSTVTKAMNLTSEQRRLNVVGHKYPMAVSVNGDLESLRIAICAAQRPIGRKPGAKGSGNNTKRIRLVVTYPSNDANDPSELADMLAGWASPIALSADEIHLARASVNFDPESLVDARRRSVAAMVLRQGQPIFRQRLLDIYNGQCPLSGCDVEAALEAAHICPYRGPETNNVQNGLLLRCDLHVLFDRGLLAIDPSTWHAVIAASLRESCYGDLQGTSINLPKNRRDWPSRTALNQHRREAGI